MDKLVSISETFTDYQEMLQSMTKLLSSIVNVKFNTAEEHSAFKDESTEVFGQFMEALGKHKNWSSLQQLLVVTIIVKSTFDNMMSNTQFQEALKNVDLMGEELHGHVN